MKATIVIGANWGDEGKGLMVDYLADKMGREDCLVVRYNGGVNAGHTVVTPEGQRHVFHHFGSGTFVGSPTYLCTNFIVNPLLWQEEAMELQELGLSPILAMSQNSMVTTPYDMLLNQEIERARGDARHGSCGLGIDETLTRNGNYPLHVLHLHKDIPAHLEAVRANFIKEWERRLKRPIPDTVSEILNSEELVKKFAYACSEMLSSVRLTNFNAESKGRHHIVFEGAQGLLLDKSNTEMAPHLTSSSTGSVGPRQMCQNIGAEHTTVIYVTRSYMTRHGAGPFPSESASLHYNDDTNREGEFQGKLRFGTLDVDLMRKHISRDYNSYSAPATVALAVTWMDQAQEDPQALIAGMAQKVCGVKYASYGPTRNNVMIVNPSI
jgi:adenylosuccinate synthase